MNPNGCTGGSPRRRSSYLELARRQAVIAAEGHVARAGGLQWVRLERDVARRRGRARVWVAILLPALLLGGAGGTYAFVRHLGLLEREQSRHEPRETVPVRTSAKPTARRAVEGPPGAPQPAPAVAVPKADPGPTRSRSGLRRHRTTDPPRTVPTRRVVVPGRVKGDDHVIIVLPPAKHRPLDLRPAWPGR